MTDEFIYTEEPIAGGLHIGPRPTETLSVCVFVEPIFGPDEIQWHGMAFVGGATVNEITAPDRTQVLDALLCSVAAAGIEVEVVERTQPTPHAYEKACEALVSAKARLSLPLRETILAVLRHMPPDAAPEHLAAQIEDQVKAWQAAPRSWEQS